MKVEREIVLAWPARELHPNWRGHWSQRAKAAKSARADSHLLTKAAGWHLRTFPEGRLHLWIDFDPPDKRRRDDDGLLASFKPHRDGIADALGIDDCRFVSHPYVQDKTWPGGRIRVRLSAVDEALRVVGVGK